jgi:hypothetical protein
MHAPRGLAVDDEAVYWSDDPVSPCTQPADPGFTIMATPKGGGSSMAFPFSAEFTPASDLAVDGTHVYWVVEGKNAVRRAAKGGGATEIVAAIEDSPAALALDATRVFWTGTLGIAAALEAPGSAVAHVAPGPLPGGGFWGIAVDCADVHVAAWDACQGADCMIMGSIRRIPKAGGQGDAIPTGADQQPYRVALGGGRVYWTQQHLTVEAVLQGAVMRAPQGGGAPELIAEGQEPRGIAVDDSCVYWADGAQDAVWKAPR